ncbi:unnamed protein product [Thelazia callipaeda]|uniref:Uncharacterized protein n=1 Tax=Thelazia callipaeda TaxID=103827 RepID=A0A0N5CTC4_THECL|nr:unnamed protein product [Thelazia callipaeda]
MIALSGRSVGALDCNGYNSWKALVELMNYGALLSVRLQLMYCKSAPTNLIWLFCPQSPCRVADSLSQRQSNPLSISAILPGQ